MGYHYIYSLKVTRLIFFPDIINRTFAPIVSCYIGNETYLIQAKIKWN